MLSLMFCIFFLHNLCAQHVLFVDSKIMNTINCGDFAATCFKVSEKEFYCVVLNLDGRI